MKEYTFKKYAFIILLFVGMGSCLGKGLKLPSNSFDMRTIEEAKAKAVEKNRPISFLYTNKDSTCGPCIRAGEVIIKELKTASVLVYVDTKSELPPNVSASLSREGKYIPKVVVYDSQLENELGLVIYEDIKANGKKAFKEVKKAIRNYRKQ